MAGVLLKYAKMLNEHVCDSVHFSEMGHEFARGWQLYCLLCHCSIHACLGVRHVRAARQASIMEEAGKFKDQFSGTLHAVSKVVERIP